MAEIRDRSHRAFISRFAVAGATVGLTVGLYEASVLYLIPRVPVLLEPDVGYVIWFLAPLLGIISFTLLGCVLGLAAGGGNSTNPWRNLICAAAGLGVAAAYVASVSNELQGSFRSRYAGGKLSGPLVWFGVVFVCLLFSLRVWRRHTERFFDKKTSKAPRSLAKALLFVTMVCASGLAAYLVGRPARAKPVQADPSSAPSAPNIVLVILDTVRADHLSAYGYRRQTTPNLDRFAAQGVVFENTVSPSSWTLPSVSSIFTGLLPHQHGANWVTPLDAGPWTLAEILRSHGYETVGFNANPFFGLAGWGMARGFDLYDDESFSVRHNLKATLVGRTLVQPAYESFIRYDLFDRRNGRELNRSVFHWLAQRSNRPFFLFVNYFDTHTPYAAPPPYDKRFGSISRAVLNEVDTIRTRHLLTPLTQEDRYSLIAGYDNCLAFLDDQVGQLLQFLASSPQGANTFIIVTSDHGDAFGEHRTYEHGRDLHWELLHVPLIIFGPGIPSGRRIPHLARTRDIFSTVIDLAFRERFPFYRTSLRRFWSPGFKPEIFDDEVISELIDYRGEPDSRNSLSLTTPAYQYLFFSRARSELYRWASDPEEKTDLGQLAQYQETVKNLSNLLYERVGSSLRPWRGLPYLLALDWPGYSILREARRNETHVPSLPPHPRRIGTSQAFFGSIPSSTAGQQTPDEKELLRSVPYN